MYKIALLGTENTHAREFAKIIHKGHSALGGIPYEDFEVVGICGDRQDQNELIREITGGKAEISDNPDAWVGKVDAIMVTARHGDKHFKFAKKYIEAGTPAFIDKPITIKPDEAIELVRLAKKHNVPLCGGSTLGFIDDVQNMKSIVNSDTAQKIYGGSVSAPCNLTSEHGGFFFYSQHLVQMMTEVFGHDIESVIAVNHDETVTFIGRYPNFDVTGHYHGSPKYAITIHEHGRTHHRDVWFSEDSYITEFRRFEHMIRTGKMPDSYEHLIDPVFILNAIYESYTTGKEVKIKRLEI
ncbi:MAG: Gfo/Idh/MocA family oxidoreductase [Oscillospiraceae bacterium]|nr:Gfo/Idh/MocA family oxidoreductase [Oscillospiraceae bacterium]